jgi:signal peptidase I
MTALNNNVHVDAFVHVTLPLSSSYANRRRRRKRSFHIKEFLSSGTDIDDEPTTTATMTLSDEIINPSSTRTNVTLNFPSYYDLMDLKPGEFVSSQIFPCRSTSGPDNTAIDIDTDTGTKNKNRVSYRNQHQFCVKLYPRGGGHGKKSRPEQLVGMYLQYLGTEEDQDGINIRTRSSPLDTVDATFALRLKGRQQLGSGSGSDIPQRRFDVEWRAGMRFVPKIEDSNLKEGYANDFGAHLMQTSLLQNFLGISPNSDQLYDPSLVLAEVEVVIHNTALEESRWEKSAQEEDDDKKKKRELQLQQLSRDKKKNFIPFFTAASNKDIRQRADGMINVHNTERVRVGKIVVPILSQLSQRPQMFEQGAYPGVEYRILRILKNGEERFTSCPGAEYELKPIYPLVAQLERPWPVSVNEKDIPRLYTSSMYNIISAGGALFVATSGLFTAFLLSQVISLFFIPSKSMDPTLQIGDVLLVDKLSPRISRQISPRNNKVDDIILFSPPSQLQEIVTKSGGNLSSRDLFVKRIAASPGDKVTVYADGDVEVNDENVVVGRRDLCEAEPLRLIEKYIQPDKDQIIDSNKVFVMGDCSSVSVDSRVWGPLDNENIRGRPILRLWPLSRFGKID